jgi:hypothetical protein
MCNPLPHLAKATSCRSWHVAICFAASCAEELATVTLAQVLVLVPALVLALACALILILLLVLALLCALVLVLILSTNSLVEDDEESP